MDVIVRGKHFDVPPAVEERARRKLGRLSHYLPLLNDATAEVDVAHEKAKEPDKRFVIHVTVSGHGVHLQAEERAAQPEAAVDQVAHVLSRQARRQKQLLYARSRAKASRSSKEPVPPQQDDDQPLVPDLVARVKRFPIKPMTAAEALEQIHALNHEFFIFHDADAGQVAVLYRRKAGDYGLIIPELS